MKQTITFHIEGKDKQLIDDEAKKERLSLSAYCRHSILKFAIEKSQKQFIPNYERIRTEESH